MHTKNSRGIAVGVILVAVLGFSFTGWNQQAQSRLTTTDTTPKRERQVRNLDDVLNDLDRSSLELEMKMKNITIDKFDGEKMKIELEKALKNIDLAKLKIDLQSSISKIDLDKMKLELAELKDLPKIDFDKLKIELGELKELKNIDLDKMKLELAELKNMPKIDFEKMKLELGELKELKNIDFEKMKLELNELKDVQLPKIELEMKNIRPKLDATMEKARVSIEKAKGEIQEYKTFQNGLEKDGLIKKDNYTIEHKNGVLKINGQVQSAEVYNKYRSFLDKHTDFEMQKNDDGFNINNNKKD